MNYPRLKLHAQRVILFLLRHKSSFVEQFVALQNTFLIPGATIEAKGDLDSFLVELPPGKVDDTGNPFFQRGCDLSIDDGRASGSSVFPGQVGIPVIPAGLSLTRAR